MEIRMMRPFSRRATLVAALALGPAATAAFAQGPLVLQPKAGEKPAIGLPPSARETPPAPLPDRTVVERANAYFNGIQSLTGDFVQIGGDGRRLGGKIYLAKPGKVRFEYDAPTTLEVVADGSSVAVRDRKLATQDIYPIGQTPLKFLLRDRIDLARDVKVVNVASDASGVRLTVEDSSTLGGTSRITLTFDPAVETLRGWRIVDPQGFQTTVNLANLDRSKRVDNRLFQINYERMIDTNRN
jgi:outer membrane lipoprotein-sorting protein